MEIALVPMWYSALAKLTAQGSGAKPTNAEKSFEEIYEDNDDHDARRQHFLTTAAEVQDTVTMATNRLQYVSCCFLSL